MRSRIGRFLTGVVITLAAGCGGSGGGGGGGSSGPLDLFVLDTSNTIWHYAPGAPGTVLGSAPVTGLAAGELLVGIDADPATGQIYGLAVSGIGTGTDARLMQVNPLTGVATPVGAGVIVPAGASDAGYGFDFNPVVNRIRVVNSADANFRIIPSNGTLGGLDVPLNPGGQQIESVAYDRNVPGGGPSDTTAYVVNAITGNLMTLGGVNSSPNSNTGTLLPVGPLATSIDPGGNVALDIYGTNQAFAIFDGNTGPPVVNGLYTVNLTTGAATLVGTLAGGPALGSFGMALR
jgi:hypothetical protein